jgi:hypothetical protein
VTRLRRFWKWLTSKPDEEEERVFWTTVIIGLMVVLVALRIWDLP